MRAPSGGWRSGRARVVFSNPGGPPRGALPIGFGTRSDPRRFVENTSTVNAFGLCRSAVSPAALHEITNLSPGIRVFARQENHTTQSARQRDPISDSERSYFLAPDKLNGIGLKLEEATDKLNGLIGLMNRHITEGHH